MESRQRPVRSKEKSRWSKKKPRAENSDWETVTNVLDLSNCSNITKCERFRDGD